MVMEVAAVVMIAAAMAVVVVVVEADTMTEGKNIFYLEHSLCSFNEREYLTRDSFCGVCCWT